MNPVQSKVLNMFDAFLLDFTRASFQLEELYKAVNSYMDCILIEKTDEGDNLDAEISKFQDICSYLKSVCSEAYQNVQLLTSDPRFKTITEEAIGKKVELTEDTTLPEQTDDLNEILPHECYYDIFTYSTIDPSKFNIGFEVRVAVTHIKNSEERSFFVCPISADIIVEQPNLRYDNIPDEGIIFGILLDGNIVAVRENQLKRTAITFRVLLIDFGEILEISKEYKMYQLPEKYQKIPGQAIFCKLLKDFNCDDQFLENILHTTQTMRIERVCGKMLEVTVNTGGNASTSNCSTNQKPTPLPKCSNVKNGLTQEQIDDLYEEPLNTENALEAVMGYVPQDDKRICKFYNPKTKACFKGARCRLEHTTILKDGWTKDKAVFKTKIHAEIPIPPVGKKINLLVTCVVDVEKFYGQIIPQNCKTTNDLPVEKIVGELNDSKMKAKLKPLTVAPAEFELVFALYNDNLWYRAKILEKISDVLFEVLYVDYGNTLCVSLDRLRKWEDVFDCHPFQALECKLDNVSKLRGNEKEAIAYFESLVLHKPVKATVTCNMHLLHVTLEDESRFDIGEQLCVSEYAEQKPITGQIAGQFPG